MHHVQSGQRHHTLALIISVAALVAACSGGANEQGTPQVQETPGTPATQASGEVQPDRGGKVITVEMITDENGSYFLPSDVTGAEGDVIRFTLTSGVHNVNFLPDSNATKKDLPKASDMLQLPGQTADVKVGMEEGQYYFQCDPHALLGMVGRLRVVEERES